MKKLNSIKDVLENAIKLLKNKEKEFICNAITCENTMKKTRNLKLIEKTSKFFLDNKPTETLHKEFYDNKYFIGQYSWWKPTLSQVKRARQLNSIKMNEYYDKVNDELTQERIRFIEHLISTL